MTEEEKFRLGREIICHENELVNHRMTWLLLVTGFLFSAFFTMIGGVDKVVENFGRLYVVLASGAIALVGIGAATTAAALIRKAHKQIAAIRIWWDATPEAIRMTFPPISGQVDSPWWLRYLSPTTEMFAWFIAVMWIAILRLTIVYFFAGHPA